MGVKENAADTLRATLTAGLRAAVVRRYGERADIDRVVFTTLGGSNLTVLFDVVHGATRQRLVFRQETYSLPSSPFISPSMQFRLLKVVHRAGIPVPEPIFEMDADDALDRAYVVSFVDGETLPRRLLDAPAFATARERFCAQAGELLARLHAIDTSEVGFLAGTADSRDPLAAIIARLDAWGEPHPALELAIRWLERHRPTPATRHLLHGDFRTGNMLMDGEGIRAVLDWECSHLGSPAEEMGWLCLRSFRFGHVDRPVGGFGRREAFYSAYAAASGRQIDPDEVYWWEVFGFLRWAQYNIMQMHGHVTGERRSAAFAACGRNTALIEYDLLMTLLGHYT